MCILQKCIPTASLGTDMIIPILHMGKLRLGEVKKLESGKRLACLTQKSYKIFKEPSREPQIQFFKPVTDCVFPSSFNSHPC